MNLCGKKALVMGLGLHGGGLESARFLLKRGASVTVTDLRDEKTLIPSIERLEQICRDLGGAPVRYVLGKHEIDDFKNADMTVKNPGVRPDSPFLQASRSIETDISLFLRESPARLFAVTGTKGKSVTSSALHWILARKREEFSRGLARIKTNFGKAYLGGNITVSPLTFLDELTKDDDVVLELSSFQLGDIKNHVDDDGLPLLKPVAAVLTAIMADHLDRYASMSEYIDDKRNIYRGQDASCFTVAGDDCWGKSFLAETKARPLTYSRNALPDGVSGGWIENGRGIARMSGDAAEIVPPVLLTPGEHQKTNLLAAGIAAFAAGVGASSVFAALSTFKGVPHRLELFHEAKGARFYNDSAATIPEAAAACIEALSQTGPLVLVTGGTDKNLDFTPLVNAAKKAKTLILLAGTGGEKLSRMLAEADVAFHGPFDSLKDAVSCAVNCASRGDVVALSPGCASFGMFLNEFDRGNRWKEEILAAD